MQIRKKILKNIIIQNIFGLITYLYICFVKLTSSVNYEKQEIPEKYWDNNKPFILAFWHSQLLMIGLSWKNKKRINILASGHSDGRFGSIVGKYFKLNNINTSKNSNSSLRIIFKLLNEKKCIGITPDGPRGPKEVASEGIIKIAKKANIPIIPLGFWSSKNFKLNSWDSFLITLPFSKCCFVWGEPITIKDNIQNNKIQEYQNLLEKKINQSIKKAQNYCKC